MQKLFIFISIVVLCSCKKLIEVDLPSNQIISSSVFKDSASANAAVQNIYTTIYSFAGAETYGGLYIDDLHYTGGGQEFLDWQSGVLPSNNTTVRNTFWNILFSAIYQSNAVIEGLKASGLSETLKNNLSGEALFWRAYSYYHLINFFGDVPLILSTAVEQSKSQPRNKISDVYAQIISDLVVAENGLSNYSVGSQKFRVNRQAAKGLLAKCYLLGGDYANAEIESSTVIGSGYFIIEPSLASVFLGTSNETILQIWNQNGYTTSGTTFIPGSYSPLPGYAITDTLLNSFEDNDQRKANWLASATVNGVVYYYSYKYKNNSTNLGTGAEYYSILRLAEQYLVRAEARNNLSRQADAISDLNVVRSRAGLGLLGTNFSKTQCDSLIIAELRHEYFTENLHRFLDLKRFGQLDQTMESVKPTWNQYSKLLPIPRQEILVNPFLTQNPGYN